MLEIIWQIFMVILLVLGIYVGVVILKALMKYVKAVDDKTNSNKK